MDTQHSSNIDTAGQAADTLLNRLRQGFHLSQDADFSTSSRAALADFFAQTADESQTNNRDLLNELELAAPQLTNTAVELASQAGKLGL